MPLSLYIYVFVHICVLIKVGTVSYICCVCTNQCYSRFDPVQILILYPGYDTIPVVDMNIVNIVINSSR